MKVRLTFSSHPYKSKTAGHEMTQKITLACAKRAKLLFSIVTDTQMCYVPAAVVIEVAEAP